MPTNDPDCRIAERGWVLGQGQDERAGEGDLAPTPLQRRGLGGGASTAAPDPEFLRGEVLPPPPTPSSEEEGAFAADPVLTPESKVRFLDALAAHGNVRVAAARVGVHRSTLYLARRRDAGFAAGWLAALVQARGHAEAVLAERALEGVEEPIYYRGELIAVRRRFDTRLLLAHLARLDQLCADADAAGAAAAAAAGQFDTVLGQIAGLPEAEAHDADSGEAVYWPPRAEYLADAEQSAVEARIDPGPIVATAAAEWDAFHARLWAALDVWLAAVCTLSAPDLSAVPRSAPREFKSLGRAGAVPVWTLSNVSSVSTVSTGYHGSRVPSHANRPPLSAGCSWVSVCSMAAALAAGAVNWPSRKPRWNGADNPVSTVPGCSAAITAWGWLRRHSIAKLAISMLSAALAAR